MASDAQVSQIVGGALAMAIRQTFSEAEGKEIICVGDFQTVEIAATIRVLADRFKISGIDPDSGPLIRITASEDMNGEPPAGIPEGLLLPPKTSLTTFRNRDDQHKYLLFVLAEQSDRQSFGQVYWLRDRDLLNAGESIDGIRLLMSEAWQCVRPDLPVPETLVSACKHLLTYVIRSVYSPSLRAVARFTGRTASCEILDGGVTRESVWRALLTSLPALDLFPDEYAAMADLRESEILGRVKKNHFAAELMTSAGRELDAEKTAQKAEATDFVDEATGDVLSQRDITHCRTLCAAYCRGPGAELREQINWGVFSQIFASGPSRKLGERVRENIEASSDGSRLAEYEKLEVEEGLNGGDPDSARILLDASADKPEMARLVELLEAGTRHAVERLAVKADVVSEFLPWLIGEMYALEETEDAGIEIKLSIDTAGMPDDAGPFTSSLFAFLYGRVLQDVEDASEVADISLSVVDEALKKLQPVSLRAIADAVERLEGGREGSVWPDLLLRIEVCREEANGGGEVHEQRVIKWHPPDIEILRFFLVSVCDESMRKKSRYAVRNEDSSEGWFGKVVDGIVDPGRFGVDPTPSQPASQWCELRASFMDEVAERGLSSESCRQYFDSWQEGALKAARSEFVLTGSPRDDFDDFMQIDTVDLGESVLMLTSHPLRVRWIGEYLARMQTILLKVLNRKLRLVDENDEFLFSSLRRLSPHQQPPYMVLPGRRVLVAVEERGWAEEYRAMSVNEGRQADWLSSVDSGSVEAIAQECARFVEFHPYKKGGIDLLVVQHSRTDFVERLTENLFRMRRQVGELHVRIHILAPESVLAEHQFFMSGSAGLVGMRDGDSLFPQVQLYVHRWNPGEAIGGEVLPDSIDLAVVPNLLVQNMRIMPKAGAAEADTTAYHPLYSRPVRQVGFSEDSVNMQLDLLPSNDDDALTDWASLGVMLLRSQPVSEDDGRGPAHLRLVIDVAASKELFADLHERALWVMTLDSYVSRKQIEQLPNRPEVITFRENIGKNGAYNLVVSSNMGRKFVVPRLEAKLRQHFAGSSNGTEWGRIAEALYRESCGLAPGIVLRSLGGGWTLHELLGLVATRRYLDSDDGGSDYGRRILNAWIPLDEHTDWFGGATGGKRADLLRVEMFEEQNDSRKLKLTVVESKFGSEQLIGQGTNQVRQSLKIIEKAFRSCEANADDGRLWRESLLSAVENSLAPGADVESVGTGSSLSDTVRNTISTGEYELAPIESHVVCHVLAHDRDMESDREGLKITCTGKGTILRLLRGESDPVQQATDRPTSSHIARGGTARDADVPAGGVVAAGVNQTSAATSGSDADASHVEVTSLSPQGLTDEEVERMYHALLDRLAMRNIEVLPLDQGDDRIIEGPSFYRIRLKPAPQTPFKKIRSAEDEIHAALELAEEDQIRIFQDRGVVWIEAPKPPERHTLVRCEDVWSRVDKRDVKPGDFEVPVGVDMMGNPICIEFSSSNSPHLLIAGTTGSGKSVALRTLLLGAMRYYSPLELRVLLIDPKGNELVEFEDDDHVKGEIGYEPRDAIALLERAVEEMQNRYRCFRDLKAKGGRAAKDIVDYNSRAADNFCRWLIVLDEYADLVSEPENKNEIERLLQRLCQKARAAGIHVIVATQKPLADIIGTVVKSNLPAVLALKVARASDSRVILDDQGAEALTGNGDALLRTGNGRLLRLQCAIHE